jgi:hypothetical protein
MNVTALADLVWRPIIFIEIKAQVGRTRAWLPPGVSPCFIKLVDARERGQPQAGPASPVRDWISNQRECPSSFWAASETLAEAAQSEPVHNPFGT